MINNVMLYVFDPLSGAGLVINGGSNYITPLTSHVS